MDAAPTLRHSLSLVLEISRDQDGRLEGQLRTCATDPWSPFSGVLELLRGIEESLDAVENAPHVQPKEGTES
jgi:hypothetical protein